MERKSENTVVPGVKHITKPSEQVAAPPSRGGMILVLDPDSIPVKSGIITPLSATIYSYYVAVFHFSEGNIIK